MKRNVRMMSSIIAGLLIMSTLSACGGGASKPADTGAATAKATATATAAATAAPTGPATSSKDTLIVATENEAPSLTTYAHNAVAGDYMNQITNNGLFKMDMNLQPVPVLAESYEIVSDTEWVFKLHKGVKFHNNTEMTAKDVKASLELCKKSPEVQQYGKSMKAVEVVDDYTVKIITDGPQAGLLADLTHHGNFILPADLIASGHDFNKEPIGTGPYKMVNHVLGDKIEFEAFADYFKGAPPIKKMVWRIIPEGSARTIALEAGEVDLIVEVETLDIARMKGNDKLTVLEKPGTSHNFLMLNNEKEPFNNPTFRKALTAAIDREAVVEVALNGFGEPSYSQLPMGFPGSSDKDGIRYDPEQAKKWLTESGVDPASVKFPIICSNDTKLRAGQSIQADLKANLGINVELVTMDLATYLEKTSKGEYTGSIGGYTSTSMLAQVKGVYYSQSINASNMTRTNNPQVDALIEKAAGTLEPAEQAKVLEELSVLMNQLNPLVPLYQNMVTRAYNNGLQGFECNAGGSMSFEALYWK